jgi:hypothetical protein
MRHLKIAVLCLAAVFMVSAVATSTAFAEALFLFPEGAAKLQAFSAKSGTSRLVAKSGADLACSSHTITGEVENKTDRVEHVVIISRGCNVTVLGKTHPCTSLGEPEGVTKTYQLNGNLGLLNKTGEAEKVGLVLKAEEGLSENPKKLIH